MTRKNSQVPNFFNPAPEPESVMVQDVQPEPASDPAPQPVKQPVKRKKVDRRVSLLLDQDVYAQLEQIAAEQDFSVNRIIREAVKQYLTDK